MGVILETERFVLRELTEGDLDFVAEMTADPEVMRFYPKVLDREGAKAWLQRQLNRYARDGHGLWLVADKRSGEPRAQVGFLIQEVEGKREEEIGYLVHRPFWRQGIAKEAAIGVRAWVRARGSKRIILLIRPENTPSAATAKSIGCTVEKRVEFHGYTHDLWVHWTSTSVVSAHPAWLGERVTDHC